MSVTKPSVFESFLSEAQKKSAYWEATLTNGLTFVFNRADDWMQYQSVVKRAKNQVEGRRKGHKNPAEEAHRPAGTSDSDWLEAMGKAALLAGYHVGFRVDGEFVEEKWDTAQFLALASLDGQALQTLLALLDTVCGVSAVDVREMSADELKKKPDSDSLSTSPPETSGDATLENS